ncbi:HEAT repeat domain-containing protein [Pseudomonadota bacterium]
MDQEEQDDVSVMDQEELDGFMDALRAIEPDLNRLASYGERALPALRNVIAGDDIIMIKKAIRVAALMGGPDCIGLILANAGSEHPDVRSTIAVALRDIYEDIPTSRQTDILKRLLKDEDAAVRRLALVTTGELKVNDVRDEVLEIAANDENEALREIAGTVQGRL